MEQIPLISGGPSLPAGMLFEPALISSEEEARLLHGISCLQFEPARYREWTAHRKVVVYPDAACIAPFLLSLRDQLATWCGIGPEDFCQVLINEYQPGVPLGWHRDAPDYELIAGVSLAGPARMRLRPSSAQSGGKALCHLDLPSRSAYVLSGDARWKWQHAISPVKALRYSLTFRTHCR